MTDALMITLTVLLVAGAGIALWKLPTGRSTASLQIELCKLNAESLVEKRRLHRLQDTVMMLTSRQAMGASLTEQEHEDLRIAHNELFHGGQP